MASVRCGHVHLDLVLMVSRDLADKVSFVSGLLAQGRYVQAALGRASQGPEGREG